MKILKGQLLCLLLMMVISATAGASLKPLRKCKIRHVEHYQTGATGFRNEKLPAKVKRKSSEKGNIVLIYDESLPDSVKIAFEVAKDIWEAKLPNKIPVYIGIDYLPLEDDVAIVTDVIYYENGEYAGTPTSLYSQLTGIVQGSESIPDGNIYLNSDIEWNCGYKNNLANEYNITTMVFRGIARCLGFGSSIVEMGDDEFLYFNLTPSLFDRLLYSGKEKLVDLEQGEAEMANFVKSNDVYIDTPDNTYKMYAPEKFVQDKSLCCFDDDGSIMSANLGAGNIAIAIDDSTIDILRTIGWDLPSTGAKIVCEDISDNGIGSAYTPHTFLLESSQSASSYDWRFYLKDKSGRFSLIQTGNSNSITINPVSDLSDLDINIDGDLEGKIECDYITNGTRLTAAPFYISLELKPSIVSITDFKRHEYDLYNFYLTFDVVYGGTDSLNIEVEEDYNTAVTVRRFNQPFIAHINTGNLSTMVSTWVTIVMTNKYGSTYKTFEFEPTYASRGIDLKGGIIGGGNCGRNRTASNIALTTTDGKMIFSGDEDSFGSLNLSSGIYIKRETTAEETSISKILIR